MDNVLAVVTEYWPVVVGALAGFIGVYVKFIAPKTKTTWDDENLPKVKEQLDKVAPKDPEA